MCLHTFAKEHASGSIRSWDNRLLWNIKQASFSTLTAIPMNKYSICDCIESIEQSSENVYFTLQFF